MRIGAAIALATLTLATAAGIARQAPPDPFAGADAAIRTAMDQAGILGAAVAVVIGDRLVWTRGFAVANVETGAPAN